MALLGGGSGVSISFFLVLDLFFNDFNDDLDLDLNFELCFALCFALYFDFCFIILVFFNLLVCLDI